MLSAAVVQSMGIWDFSRVEEAKGGRGSYHDNASKEVADARRRHYRGWHRQPEISPGSIPTSSTRQATEQAAEGHQGAGPAG
jgi:hypothetical protein